MAIMSNNSSSSSNNNNNNFAAGFRQRVNVATTTATSHSNSNTNSTTANRSFSTAFSSSSGGRPRTALIVGGGIAGVSLSWQLSKLDVQVTLLEKSKFLCAGATWHAAGLVTRFAGSPKLKKLHVRAITLLNELHDKTEGGISLHRPGSIRIVEKGNIGRYEEAKQHVNMAVLYDDPALPTCLIGPEEISKLHPLCDVSKIDCAIWTPKDGDIDPTTLVNNIAPLAKQNGAQFHLSHEVTGIERLPGNRFAATTKNGQRFEADILVNAAGLWSKNVSNMVDKSILHPAFIIEHQYAITEAIPAIVKRMAAQGEKGRLPVLRDLAGSSYIRQEGQGLLIGPYEPNCRLAPSAWRTSPPSNFEFDLFPPQFDEIEGNLVSVMNLIPSIAEIGWKSVTNGPTIWTGDSLPRCGPAQGIPNYWDFNTLTYGIAQSIPLAEYLASYIVHGEQPFDLAAQCAPGRYGRWANEGYVEPTVKDTYAKNNAIGWLFENRPVGREAIACRKDPLHKQLLEKGGVMGFSLAGVETPLVYDPNYSSSAASFAKYGQQSSFSHFSWSALALAEADHVKNGVGIAHASFSKLRVQGPQAQAFLDFIGTNDVPTKIGTTRLTYSITPAGKIAAEFTVAKIAEGDFYLVGSRDYVGHDVEWLSHCARQPRWNGQVRVSDASDDVEILHVAGPLAKNLLQPVCATVAEIPFLQFKPVQIAGVNLNLFRVSFSGLHGFELHCPAKDASRVYEAVWNSETAKAVNLRPFGSLALNALRVEVGFKIKADLDYAHYTEAGIEFFIGKNKKDKTGSFQGQNPQHTLERRAAHFRVNTTQGYEWSIVSDCPIRNSSGTIVGFTTSAAPGARTGKTLAQGYLTAPHFDDVATGNTTTPAAGSVLSGLWMECYGKRYDVELLTKPASEVTGRKAFEQ